MKKFYHSIFYLLICTWCFFAGISNSHAQWMRSPGATNYHSDVAWLDENTAIAIGNRGTIIKSLDGGLTWQAKASKTDFELRSLFFISEEIGWAAGVQGTLLKSIDGGDNWSSFPISTLSTLECIHFIDENIGWVGGQNGEIYTTSNGGFTWTLVASPTMEIIQSIYFTTALKGTAVGTNGLVMTTHDGGLNWSVFVTNSFQTMLSVTFINENEGFLGGFYTFMKTTDGGLNWTTIPDFTSVFDIQFKNEVLCVARDQHQFSISNDYGNSWNTVLHSSLNNVMKFGYNGNQNVILIDPGNGILVSQNMGSTWASVLSVFPNNYYAMHFTDQNTGWIAGTNGSVRKTSDGGHTWQQVLTGSSGFYAIRMQGNTGIAAGAAGAMKRTTDGGATWANTTSGTSQTIYDVAFLNATTVFFSSENGLLRKSTDSGSTWTSVTTGVNNPIRKIFFVDALTGWLCGHGGVIMKTTDGGQNWSTQISGTNSNLLSIDFVSATTGFVTGATGTLLKTTNGGQTWTQQNANTTEHIMSIDFMNATTGIAVGNTGMIRHTYDGGTTWSAPAFPSPTEFVCNAVQQIAPGKAVAVANNGNIILFEEPCGNNALPLLYNMEEEIVACNGQSVEIFGGATGVLEWYDGPDPNTATLLGTGSSFASPQLESASVFYVFNTACNSSQNENINYISFGIDVLNAPVFTGYTDGNICGPGSATIQGLADSGTIQWYSEETGGVVLGTGNDFTTPIVSENTLYFAEANNGCVSEFRIPVIVNVHEIPQFINVYSTLVCDLDSSYAYADGDFGDTFWYAAPTDSISIATGDFYVTPLLSETTTYYAELVSNMGCVSENRAEIVISVFASPEILETSSTPVCGMGNSELYALASEGSVIWLDQPMDGGVIATGNNATSPLITESTTVYAMASNNGCSSDPIAVVIPYYEAITGSVVVNGSTLSASYGNVNYQWYDCDTEMPIDGATGASFTPEITGTYYCLAYNDQCSVFSGCYEITITGISEFSPTTLSIYPNPAQEFIRIHTSSPDIFVLYSVDGKKTGQFFIQPGELLDISNLAPGCYRLVSVQTGNSASLIVE